MKKIPINDIFPTDYHRVVFIKNITDYDCVAKICDNPQKILRENLWMELVELEGVEPSSKQGNHTLSTCLFLTSVFVLQQDQDHQLQPYPLKLHLSHEATADYSRFTCTA